MEAPCPLVELKFTKTPDGDRLEKASVSRTFGFKQFTTTLATIRSRSSARSVGD